MKPVQLILIGVAVLAGVAALLGMMSLNKTPDAVAVAPVKQVPKQEVLVVNQGVPMGNRLGASNLKWEEWPESIVREQFITKKNKPDAVEEFSKAIASTSFYEGEPVREAKLVHSDSGYLSAILPAGKRAMSIRTSAATAAGGFILPNDRVDVVMGYTIKEDGSDEKLHATKTVLQNIRVLAIDQIIEDEQGKKSIIGATATLELDARQTEILAGARGVAKSLALTLRSVEDAGLGEASSDVNGGPSGSIRIIRYGATAEVQPRK